MKSLLLLPRQVICALYRNKVIHLFSTYIFHCFIDNFTNETWLSSINDRSTDDDLILMQLVKFF